MNRRRLVGLLLVGGTAVAVGATLKSAEHDLTVRYEAPPGPLTVTLTTAEGQRVRRTSFAPGVSRQHEIRLPNGQFEAQLELPNRPAYRQAFTVEADQALLIEWRP